MTDPIWFNGEIMPMAEARIGVEDHGFQFADGVYEVMRLYHGRPFACQAHLHRLARSAEGIGLRVPLPTEALIAQIDRLVAAEAVRDGMLYLQLTRGVAPRSHLIDARVRPTLLFYARHAPPPVAPGAGEGAKLLSVIDERWKRCWIKSIALLPNVLAKQQAAGAGADEAVFIDEGIATECASSNLFAVIDSKLVTTPVGSKVLPGITRAVVIDIARQMGIAVEERPLREEEAMAASELFLTSTMREVSWVAVCNECTIGEGRCGAVTLTLHQKLMERIAADIAM